MTLESLDSKVFRFVGVEPWDENVFVVEAANQAGYVEICSKVRQARRFGLKQTLIVLFCFIDDRVLVEDLYAAVKFFVDELTLPSGKYLHFVKTTAHQARALR